MDCNKASRRKQTGSELDPMLLERKLKPLHKLKVSEVPPACLRAYCESTLAGGKTLIPTGIGYEGTIGWFVLSTQGQGPCLVWPMRRARKAVK